MKIPSYVPRLAADAVGPISYRSAVPYRAGNEQPREKGGKAPYITAKASTLLPKGYGVSRLFRYSRRRPRKLTTQKSGCFYCGGRPNDKPVIATASIAARMAEKKTLAAHCTNCGVAVA